MIEKTIVKLYFDLLYAVERKFPGESRHTTALRYIREAEGKTTGPAQRQIDHEPHDIKVRKERGSRQGYSIFWKRGRNTKTEYSRWFPSKKEAYRFAKEL